MQSIHHEYDRLTISNSHQHKSASRGEAFSVPARSNRKWPFGYTLIGMALVCGGFWWGAWLGYTAAMG